MNVSMKLTGSFVVLALLFILTGTIGWSGLGTEGSRGSVLLVMTISGAGALVAIAAALSFARGFSAPLKALHAQVENLRRGRRTLPLELKRNDEIGRLSTSLDALGQSLEKEIVASLQKMSRGHFDESIRPLDSEDILRHALRALSDEMRELLGQIGLVGNQIGSAASQVADSSQTLSQGATEQAASLQEISASMNQITSQTQLNADNAGQASTLAGQARDSADRGNQQMSEMVNAMAAINESGNSISKIIKAIDEIAFQTNLLALNAAVEAARAGQHGKGFAVVAEEVRNLAARSAKAAQETSALIEDAVARAEYGCKIADQTAESLTEITTGITRVADLAAEISAASSEQAQGLEQINIGLGQIDQATQQNTASAEESAAAAEQLSGMAAELNQRLEQFHCTAKQSNAGRREFSASPGSPRSRSTQIAAPSHRPAAATKPSTGKEETTHSLIDWSDDLSVNIGVIDMQHKRLVEMINKLYHAMKTGKGDQVMGPLFVDLIEYTGKHFATEERFMKDKTYPDYESHKAEHEKLVARVLELKAKLEKGEKVFSSEVFNFLKGWLINHIQGTDKKYAPFLNERGVY
ncbi:bacteriohemerythrin [Geoalkalibacter subterraneus]|uniref:bacteriohemerythrin n=1 Tax=Geoalkalibacter subterraneus TaxID=483547 RepID=UPI0006947483|nr:bacteriohemerythrin [Geoalkalibacter subterraneus]